MTSSDIGPPKDTAGTAGPGLSSATALLLALACGLSVANIYFAQPLLDAMARDLGIAPAAIGMVVTFTQIGYATGLILIVPLGDLWDRRRLIAGQIALSAIGLVVVGTASHAAVLLAGLTLVGVLAVVVQVLVAFAATLAAPDRRGRTIGTVTGGVVGGILLARFAAGALADLGGWRTVYLVSACLMLAMAALLLRVLPRGPHATMAGSSYWSLLRSTAALFTEEPILRERALLAFLILPISMCSGRRSSCRFRRPLSRCRTRRLGCSGSPVSPERSARAMPAGSPTLDGRNAPPGYR